MEKMLEEMTDDQLEAVQDVLAELSWQVAKLIVLRKGGVVVTDV